MLAGERDQQIFVQAETEINVSGQLNTTWTPLGSETGMDWAKVITERGTEAIQSSRLNDSEIIRAGLNYRSDVTEKCRFQWNGLYYYIRAVDTSMRRQGELWLIAERNARNADV